MSSQQVNNETNHTNINKDKKKEVKTLDITDVRLPSICIPRVDSWVTSDYIENIMNEVLLPQDTYLTSCIERIDLIGRQNERGEDYKRCFIHFKPWNSFECASSKKMREKLLSGETVKIMHNNPSYWKCSASRVPRPQWNDHSAPVEKQRSKAFLIDDNESNDISSEEEAKKNVKKQLPIMKKKINISMNTNNTNKKDSSKEYKPKWLGESVFESLSNNDDIEVSTNHLVNDDDKINSNKVINNEVVKKSNSKKYQKKNFPHPPGKAPAGKVWDSVIGTWVQVNRKL